MELRIVDLARGTDHAAEALDRAFAETGFAAVRNLGIDAGTLQRAFSEAAGFFHADTAFKGRFAYRSAAENFGYQAPGEEYLDPAGRPDLKETLTLRNLLHGAIAPGRWPSAAFGEFMTTFHRDCLEAAYRLLRLLAGVLDVPEDFFVHCHRGENVTLRLLHYPPLPAEAGQLGAGAHTDYGMLTLLFQDDAGGLEVRDADGTWQPVTPVADTVVINAGDLLERWTNGRYRSTWHRVQPRSDGRERFSIAFFVDPDSATRVEVLPACLALGDA
jgi:isopenicillin N synthase-like dioxygenase